MQIGIYLHFKGTYYRVIGTAVHTETHEELAIYYPLNALPMVMYARPSRMFDDDVTVEHGSGIPSAMVKRFRYICEIDQ